jgi:hypothetical protein
MVVMVSPRSAFRQSGLLGIGVFCILAGCGQPGSHSATIPASSNKASTGVQERTNRHQSTKSRLSDCQPHQHRLAHFEGCVDKTLNGDFGVRSVDVGILAPIDAKLLATVVDVEALRERIRPYIHADPTRGEALCSLYQTGIDAVNKRDVAWLQGMADRDPLLKGRYLALALTAILTKRATTATVDAVLQGIEARLSQAIASDPADRVTARRMLANYLMTAKLFGARSDRPAIQKVIELLYPSRTLQVPEKLFTGFVQDVVNVRLLGWTLPSHNLRSLIERSSQANGEVRFSDCDGETCRYKAYQVTMSLDQLADIFTPDERQKQLQAFVSKMEDKVSFGHIRSYGLSPKDLWKSSRCDYFCSVKHWTVLVTLNHLLNTNRTVKNNERKKPETQ